MGSHHTPLLHNYANCPIFKHQRPAFWPKTKAFQNFSDGLWVSFSLRKTESCFHYDVGTAYAELGLSGKTLVLVTYSMILNTLDGSCLS
jgi:hypothetical protein